MSLLSRARDTYRRILHVGQVREWLGRHGVTFARTARGDWWVLPALRVQKGYRYLVVQAWWLKRGVGFERRT